MSDYPVQKYSTLDLPLDRIAQLCRRYGVSELAVFGSALRPDFHPESDIDFLVTFHNDDLGPWMSKLPEMESDLSLLLDREVDLVNRRGIEQSRNSLRKGEILNSAITIYEAG